MSRSDVLVDADWVQAHLDDPKVVIVEVDEDTSAYEKNHIKNAIRIDWKQDLQDPVRRDFVDQAGFEKLLSAKGIANDDTGGPLRRQQQLVRLLRLLVLQALRPRGRQAARRRPQEVGAGLPRPGRRGPRARPPPTYKAKPQNTSIRAFRDDVVAAIGIAEPGRRPLARRVLRQAARPGAPPAGAVAASGPRPDRPQHPVVEERQRRRHLQVRRRAQGALRRTRASTSPRTPSPTAASASAPRSPGSCCTSCSARTNVKNYDGSWTEYGSLVGVPIELGANK